MSAISMRLEEGKRGAVGESDVEFVWLFRTQYEGLVRTVYLIVHDREQARDIAQEAFIQLFTRWRRIAQYERPEAWIRRVAIRMAVRAIKRERLRPHLERELDVASLPKPVDIDVLRAVRRLPATLRAAVVLFYFEDRPVAEIADILACSEVTVKVHLHRARKRLAELLGERETEEIHDVP